MAPNLLMRNIKETSQANSIHTKYSTWPPLQHYHRRPPPPHQVFLLQWPLDPSLQPESPGPPGQCGVSSGTNVPFPQRHCCHLSREILKRLSLENETRNGSTWVKPCLELIKTKHYLGKQKGTSGKSKKNGNTKKNNRNTSKARAVTKGIDIN